MAMTLNLLPRPRHLIALDGLFALPAQGLIVLEAAHPYVLRPIAVRLQRALAGRHSIRWEIQAGAATTLPGTAVTLRPSA